MKCNYTYYVCIVVARADNASKWSTHEFAKIMISLKWSSVKTGDIFKAACVTDTKS